MISGSSSYRNGGRKGRNSAALKVIDKVNVCAMSSVKDVKVRAKLELKQKLPFVKYLK